MGEVMVVRVEQRKRLFQLLRLKRIYRQYDTKVLDEMIVTAEAEMEEEDVAYVEKKVTQLP